MRRNGKRPANVGAGVLLSGDGQATACIHADGEARFQLEEDLLDSHLGLLANAHGSQLESQIAVHGAEEEQRCLAALLRYLRRDLELVVFEEYALRLGS